MNKLPTILALLILCFLTIIKSERLFACSCEGEFTVKEAVKHSNIVFNGQVISKIITSNLSLYGVRIEVDNNNSSFAARQTKSAVAIFRIKVAKIYKGKSQSDTISIITPTNGAACGVVFKVGQNYIIYGTTVDETLMGNSVKRFSTNNKTYWTNLCTRTGFYYKQEEDAIKAVKN